MVLPHISGVPAPPSREQLAAYADSVGDVAAGALPGFVSIVWKGSAVKPWEGPYDFLPGLSDLDIHVYRPGGQGDGWELRERIAALGPAPGDTPLQLLVLDCDALPEWWTLIPGTYHVLHGEPPPVDVPPQATLLVRDEMGLAEAPGQAEAMESEIVAISDERLWEYLQSQRGIIPSALYRAVAVAGHPSAEVWSLNRTRLLALMATIEGLEAVHRAGTAYLDAALAAGRRPGAAEAAAEALRAGQHLLRTAGAWYATLPNAREDRRASGL